MGSHLQKRFTDDEVKKVLSEYQNGEIEVKQALLILNTSRTQFFEILKRYKEEPKKFTLKYKREKASRKISELAEKKIIQELKKEKKLIEDQRNTLRGYNYSFIKDLLEKKHEIKVSLPTIIDRAKKMNFIKRERKRNLMIEKF